MKGKTKSLLCFVVPCGSLENNYVEPFLNARFEDGTTNTDGIRECGFVRTKFKGSSGAGEVVRKH